MGRMNEKEKRFAKSDLGNEFIKIEKKLGFIIIKDELILTVAHQTRRFYTYKIQYVFKKVSIYSIIDLYQEQS